MKKLFLKAFVRTKFFLTSRKRVIKQITRTSIEYQEIAFSFTSESGRQSIEVPKMLGVDEDMRRWSFYMLLEHNVIVNHAITANICRLANAQNIATNREKLSNFDPKKDVMPSANPGQEQLAAFFDSIKSHLNAVEELPKLRGTARSKHPFLGMFDAHQWNCMFVTHLRVHLRQARDIKNGIT